MSFEEDIFGKYGNFYCSKFMKSIIILMGLWFLFLKIKQVDLYLCSKSWVLKSFMKSIINMLKIEIVKYIYISQFK